MTNLFFQIALSNTCIALVLAFAALIVEVATKRSQLAHLLWLLVFVKLVTPPIFTLPVVPFSGQPEAGVESVSIERPAEGISGSDALMAEMDSSPSLWASIATASNSAKPWLVSFWLLGSGVIFFTSLTRVYRFNRLLKTESAVAPETLQTSASRIAYRFGLKAAPTIHTTSAHLSPMVWWIGGRVRVIIPLSLINQMDTKEAEWILAHELAHVRRRDYLVRWIEWLACVIFWWNPLVWWARHRLRANEEICCDDLVLARFNAVPHTYATALLNAIEFLASPVIRPPAMASEINSGGFLERRFKMITSNTSTRSITRWPQVCVLLLAVGILPVGLVVAGEHDSAKKETASKTKPAHAKKEAQSKKQSTDEYYKKTWKKLQAKVDAGKMTQEEAHSKMAAIKKEKHGPKTITREDYAKAEKKIHKAVKAGEISPEEGRKKLQWMRKEMAEQADRERGMRLRPISQEEYDQAEAHMKKMVEAGKISGEDARRKLAEMRRMMAGEHDRKGQEHTQRRITQADYDRTEAQLFKAVENGRISAEDARKKLQGMRKAMAGQRKQGEHEQGERKER